MKNKEIVFEAGKEYLFDITDQDGIKTVTKIFIHRIWGDKATISYIDISDFESRLIIREHKVEDLKSLSNHLTPIN